MKTIKTTVLLLFLIGVFTFSANGQSNNKKGDVYYQVDEMPEYPGGEEALKKFIADNIKYPEEARKNGITGKVYVSFIVDKTGEVRDAQVARGVDPSLDKESLRVINQLERFKPGKQDGKPVKVAYTIPINYALDGKPEKENDRK